MERASGSKRIVRVRVSARSAMQDQGFDTGFSVTGTLVFATCQCCVPKTGGSQARYPCPGALAVHDAKCETHTHKRTHTEPGAPPVINEIHP